MRLAIHTLAVAAAAASAFSVPSFAQGVEIRVNSVRDIADGLRFIEYSILRNYKNLHVIRVSLNRYDVRVLAAQVSFTKGIKSSEAVSVPDRSARGYFLDDYRRRYGAIAAMSAGYIDSYSPPTPLGFVKSAGVIINGIHKSWLMTGIFCSDEGVAQITPIEDAKLMQRMRDCVQAGPLLIYRGKVFEGDSRNSGMSKLARSIQSQGFVCIDRSGSVLLGVSDEIDLQMLVDVLRDPQIGCVDALRLTGKETAGLKITTGLSFGDDDFLLPNALAVIPRN